MKIYSISTVFDLVSELGITIECDDMYNLDIYGVIKAINHVALDSNAGFELVPMQIRRVPPNRNENLKKAQKVWKGTVKDWLNRA